VKFWTAKFMLALTVVVGLLVDAQWFAPDPYTGKPRHLLPFTDSGAAPFVFLLSLLYVLSHAGGWVLARFRRHGAGDERASQSRRR